MPQYFFWANIFLYEFSALHVSLQFLTYKVSSLYIIRNFLFILHFETVVLTQFPEYSKGFEESSHEFRLACV